MYFYIRVLATGRKGRYKEILIVVGAAVVF